MKIFQKFNLPLSKGLEQKTSRGPVQHKLFYNSMISVFGSTGFKTAATPSPFPTAPALNISST